MIHLNRISLYHFFPICAIISLVLIMFIELNYADGNPQIIRTYLFFNLLFFSYTFLSTTKSSTIHFSQRKYLLPLAFLLQQILLLQPSIYSCVGCKNSSIYQLLKSFRSSTTFHPKSLRSIWQFWSFGCRFSGFQWQIKKVFKDIGACFWVDLLRLCACGRIWLDRLLYIQFFCSNFCLGLKELQFAGSFL